MGRHQVCNRETRVRFPDSPLVPFSHEIEMIWKVAEWTSIRLNGLDSGVESHLSSKEGSRVRIPVGPLMVKLN